MKLGTNYVHLLIEDKHVDCWDRTWPTTSWNMSLSLYYTCNKHYSPDLGGHVNQERKFRGDLGPDVIN